MLGIISSRPCDAVKVVVSDAGLQRAVQRAGGAAFALHLDHRRHGAPDVGLLLGGPLVRPFAHVGGRRDGINGDDFVGLMRDVGGGFVAVDGDLRTSVVDELVNSPLLTSIGFTALKTYYKTCLS